MKMKNLNSNESRSSLDNLAVMLTHKCQMNCRYCFTRRDLPDMDQTTLFQAIDLLFTSPSEEVELQFFGGEPLLKWDLIKRGINYAEKKSLKTRKRIRYLLSTNGLLLDKRKIDFLKKYKITILFSLDGYEKTQFENRPLFTQKKYSSDILVKNLKNLMESKIDYFVNITFLPQNLKDLKNNINYLLNLGVTDIQLSYAVGTYWPKKDISFYLKILNDIIRIPNLNLRNLINNSEPILASPQSLVDTSGKVYIGCAGVLEKKYPQLNKSFYFGQLQKIKNIDSLYKNPDDIYFLLKENLRKEKKIFFNNIYLGRKLSHFFNNFFYENTAMKNDENSFFVNFLKNEFILQKDLVKQLKIDALFFHLKGNCLNNCIFCKQKNDGWTNSFEAIEEFSTTKSNAWRKKIKKLCLIGSESLLHPKILDIVASARNNGFSEVEIMTSGELLSDKSFLKKLVENGTTSFSIPIFGSQEHIHDSIVQRKGSFQELTEALNNLKEIREIKVFVHTNLLKQNLSDLPDLEKLITKKFGFPFVILPVRAKFANLSFKAINPSYSEIIDALKKKTNHLFGFPYCVSKNIQKNSLSGISDSMKLYFIHQKFVKPNICKNCFYQANCLGVSKDYLNLYSDRELKKYGKFKNQK